MSGNFFVKRLNTKLYAIFLVDGNILFNFYFIMIFFFLNVLRVK